MGITMGRFNDPEEDLIQATKQAVSESNWSIGESASIWMQRHARGRTDVDFGLLTGLGGDHVYQCRRVWEAFSDVRSRFAVLKWSHFYAALNWDDAAENLEWASDVDATVAEMKAWRRATRGEDLVATSEE